MTWLDGADYLTINSNLSPRRLDVRTSNLGQDLQSNLLFIVSFALLTSCIDPPPLAHILTNAVLVSSHHSSCTPSCPFSPISLPLTYLILFPLSLPPLLRLSYGPGNDEKMLRLNYRCLFYLSPNRVKLCVGYNVWVCQLSNVEMHVAQIGWEELLHTFCELRAFHLNSSNIIKNYSG